MIRQQSTHSHLWQSISLSQPSISTSPSNSNWTSKFSHSHWPNSKGVIWAHRRPQTLFKFLFHQQKLALQAKSLEPTEAHPRLSLLTNWCSWTKSTNRYNSMRRIALNRKMSAAYSDLRLVSRARRACANRNLKAAILQAVLLIKARFSPEAIWVTSACDNR